jgi:Predicted Zn-dependent protease (DUF2268)
MSGMRWTCLLLLTAACAWDGTAPDAAAVAVVPAEARFVATDITNFWRAVDAGGSPDAFQREYLDKASDGLRDFVAARNVTAPSLSQMVRAYPRYFADVRASMLRLTASGEDAVLARIRANYERVEALYPAAVYPPVTFLVGRFSTGGTVRESGILIGTEFYSMSPTTPVDELQQFHRDVVRPLDSLPGIVAHEHTHVLQARTPGLLHRRVKTLLDQALIEGSADFVGELASGTNVNAWLRDYALAREAVLWDEFQLEMRGTNTSRWLYNQGSATADRPGDLGYFIGYQITKAYYDRAADKREALREIIEVRDAVAFLAASGYDGGR